MEEVKKEVVDLEIAENTVKTTQESEEENECAETDNDIAKAEQLREAEEDREVGTVSFNVDAKYFMFGAPALMLLLMLLIIIAGQGKNINESGWSEIYFHIHVPFRRSTAQ